MPGRDAPTIAGRKPLVLIVEDQAVVREPILLCLQNAGYETIAASGGEEALALVERHCPDLLILDVHMAGMDGLTLLSRLRQRPATVKTPAIMLTMEADRRFVVRAVGLGVRQYVLKSRFSVADLLERTRSILAPIGTDAAQRIPPLTTNPPARMEPPRPGTARRFTTMTPREQIIERTEKALEGKALSGVAAQVIAMAAAPNSSMSELGVLISRDPTLSANVLRVANSAAYTSSKSPVTTIFEAIRKIGCGTVCHIASAIGVIKAIPPGTTNEFNPIRAWQHSIAVAQICQRITPQTDHVGGVAYLAGLCHDLADILFQIHFPEECAAITEAQQSTGMSRGDAEQSIVGIRRAELTSIVLGKLGLPEAIRVPIIGFQNAMATGKMPANHLARLLMLGEMYANGVLLAWSNQSLVTPFTKTACKEATGVINPPCPDAQTLRAEVFTLTTMLARLGPAEDARMCSPLIGPVGATIWLARDRDFSAFDPLAAALLCLADVRLSERLPTAREAADCDAIVVATSGSSVYSGLSGAEISAAPPTRSGLPPLWLKTDSEPAVSGRLPITLAELQQFAETAYAKSGKAAA